mmetsp:Transcript_83897/g.234173  ORF Transcript_83897/g.234173 Transcript_83897/m.234173 type:complete len:887 (-) Transcript_83897:31-2691(-)
MVLVVAALAVALTAPCRRRSAVAVFAMLSVGASPVAPGLRFASEEPSSGSPIGRVLSMLAAMRRKLRTESVEERELFDQAMSRCESSGAQLRSEIAEVSSRIPQLEASIQEAAATTAQLQQELKDHQADYQTAVQATREASNAYMRDSATFDAASAEQQANLDAVAQAIGALERGGAGVADGKSSGGGNLASAATGFWQSDAAVARVQGLALMGTLVARDQEKKALLAFLQEARAQDLKQSADDQPLEVLGILRQMQEELQEEFAAMKQRHEEARQSTAALTDARFREIMATSAAMRDKNSRVGGLKVQLAQWRQDLGNLQEAFASNQKLKADLDRDCGRRRDDYVRLQQSLVQEGGAINETLALLSGEAAEATFADAIPTSLLSSGGGSGVSGSARAASLLQVRAAGNGRHSRGHGRVGQSGRRLRRRRRRRRWPKPAPLGRDSSAEHPRQVSRSKFLAVDPRPQAEGTNQSGDVPDGGGPSAGAVRAVGRRFDFDFGVVAKLVDKLLVRLSRQQQDEDERKAACESEIRKAVEQQDALEQEASTKSVEFAAAQDQFNDTDREIGVVRAGISRLDREVDKSTKERKEENAEYVRVRASIHAAVELIELARRRLSAFYGDSPRGDLAAADTRLFQQRTSQSKPLGQKKQPMEHGQLFQLHQQQLHGASTVQERDMETRNTREDVDEIHATAAEAKEAEGAEEDEAGEIDPQETEEAEESRGPMDAQDADDASKATPEAGDEATNEGGAKERSGEKHVRASARVFELLNEVQQDLKMEASRAESAEGDAQDGYEQFMRSAAEKRRNDAKELVTKTEARAALRAALSKLERRRGLLEKKLAEVGKVLVELHAQCDSRLENHAYRESARQSEASALRRARETVGSLDSV